MATYTARHNGSEVTIDAASVDDAQRKAQDHFATTDTVAVEPTWGAPEPPVTI